MRTENASITVKLIKNRARCVNIPKIISKTLEFLAPICYNNVLYTRTSGTTAQKGI